MLGRFFYALLPIVFTLGTLALALVSFFASFRTNSGGLRNIYFMQLNFSDIQVQGFDVTSLINTAGIHQIYQVGANGYCYGDLDDNDQVTLLGCETPTTPFWFDLMGIFRDSKAGSLLDLVSIPDELSSYENIIKKTSYAIWSLLVATACLAFIVFVLGLFSACSRVLSIFIFIFSILLFLTAGVAAAAATALFKIYTDKFNDTASQFGATAHMGRVAMGLIWGMVAAALLSVVFWSLLMCCGSTRRKKSSDESTVQEFSNKDM